MKKNEKRIPVEDSDGVGLTWGQGGHERRNFAGKKHLTQEKEEVGSFWHMLLYSIMSYIENMCESWDMKAITLLELFSCFELNQTTGSIPILWYQSGVSIEY